MSHSFSSKIAKHFCCHLAFNKTNLIRIGFVLKYELSVYFSCYQHYIVYFSEELGRLNDLKGRLPANMKYANETHCMAHSGLHVST